MNFFFIPFVLKAKYYPYVLLAIFTILSFKINLELLCGIGFAFLYHRHLQKKNIINNNIVTKLSDTVIFNWMKNLKGFIDIGGVELPSLQNNLEKVTKTKVQPVKISSERIISVGKTEKDVNEAITQVNSIDYNNKSNEDTANESKLDVNTNDSK